MQIKYNRCILTSPSQVSTFPEAFPVACWYGYQLTPLINTINAMNSFLAFTSPRRRWHYSGISLEHVLQ